MKSKHTPSNFKLEQEITKLGMQLRNEKLQKNIDLHKNREKPTRGELFELILLLLIFVIFSFCIFSYYITTNKSIQLLQFANSLITFAIGLVISDMKK